MPENYGFELIYYCVCLYTMWGERATVRMLGGARVRSCHSVLVGGALTTVRMWGERSSSAHVKATEQVCGVRPSPSTWVWGSNSDHLAYS